MLSKSIKNIQQLHRRDLPTKYHQEAWKSYDKILMYRTNVSGLLRFLHDAFWFANGASGVQKAHTVLNAGKVEVNEDFTDATLSIF